MSLSSLLYHHVNQAIFSLFQSTVVSKIEELVIILSEGQTQFSSSFLGNKLSLEKYTHLHSYKTARISKFHTFFLVSLLSVISFNLTKSDTQQKPAISEAYNFQHSIFSSRHKVCVWMWLFIRVFLRKLSFIVFSAFDLSAII